ncbi:MAG: DUF4349 domain-containing protein [Solirubrobacteraceae bacterium]|nr:DUF4349 domain-containing protein [Solirubrobacteraceae bacterium]
MRPRNPLTPEQERDLEALDRALAGDPVESDLHELEELVREVRATAPEMSPAFAARLAEDVREGFPSSPERPPLRGRSWPWTGRRWVLLPVAGSLAALLVALVVVLGGVERHDAVTAFSGETSAPIPREESAAPPSGATTDDAASSARGAGDRAPSTASPSPTARDRALPVPPMPSPSPIAPGRDRDVQRSAVLALQTPDDRFEATAAAVSSTVARFGGIVASSQIGSSDANGGEASFDLRIPTERLDRALAALAKLGHVTERSQSLEDITAPVASARERLSDARAERRGLRRALERATTQERIDSLRARLRSVDSRISSAASELAALRRSADLSTVLLTVRGDGERGSTGAGGHWTPGDAAGDALRVLEVLAGVALVALAVVVPLALVGLAIALAVGFGRRRRREAALDPG